MFIKAKDYGFTDEQCENAKKATLNTGHSTVPKDSKYRRQREGIVNEGKTQKR